MSIVPEPGEIDGAAAPQRTPGAMPQPLRRSLQLLVLVTLLPLVELPAWFWLDDASGLPREPVTVLSLIALPLA